MADDIRIARWNLLASAGVTQRLVFTADESLTSLSVYTGGSVSDVDDLTDATEHAGTLSTTTVANDTATVDLAIPTTGVTPLRLVIAGAVVAVGRLTPSTSGTVSADNTITLSADERTYSLTVGGIVVGEGGGGAGTDDQTAAEVPFTPTGTIAATDVQAAIAEVSGDVTAEAVTRAAADAALSDLITTEQTTRAAADTALDGRLDTAEATLAGLGTAATKNTGTAAGDVPVLDGSGLIADALIPAGIARDAEVTTAVQAAINGLLDGAPGALDTLNELAAAIGDDANFAATVTAALGGKQAQSTELTLLAALTSTPFGRSLLEQVSAATLRGTLNVEDGATADQTGAEIKTAYEAEADTNAYTDAEKTKLTGVATGATANSPDATLLARANHTGTQAQSTIVNLTTDLAAKADADGEYAVNTVAASGATETLTLAPAHKVTMDQNCTFTFPTPTAGHTFLLLLAGAFTPTFPASVDWDSATAPTYATPSLYGFTTVDGGTTWLGTLIASGLG